jgi:hypothetical protein
MLIGLDMIQLLEEVVAEGVETGVFRADLAQDRAVVLIGQLLYGTITVRADEPQPVPVDQAAEELCTFIEQGLGGGRR